MLLCRGAKSEGLKVKIHKGTTKLSPSIEYEFALNTPSKLNLKKAKIPLTILMI